MLKLNNLNVKIDNKQILNNFNLNINKNEIHVIMGPNGTGKSTLSKVIMGNKNYEVEGKIIFNDEDITNLPTDERARKGIFLAYQNPMEIEGLKNSDFLRTALHIKEGNEFNLMNFIKKQDEITTDLKMNKDMIHRSLNVGFSGGEKKKNEILAMYLLKPSLIILDEIDSGLDVDSLKIVGENINKYYENNDCSILIITHYQRLLNYIKPDKVHILKQGNIVKTGDSTLVNYIEDNGFSLEGNHE